MATDRYDYDAPPPQKGDGCFKGCLIAAIVFLVVVVLVGWWVARNWRAWAASIGAEVMQQAIDSSELPAEEKAQLNEQIRRLKEGYANGEISDDQMGRLVQELPNSPLFTFLIIQSVDVKYLQPSGLTDEEKAEAKITLERFASGIMTHQIDRRSIEQALKPVTYRNAEGKIELKDQVTDEELRTFLGTAKQQADAANIPQKIPPIDPSDELEKIIDKALVGP